MHIVHILLLIIFILAVISLYFNLSLKKKDQFDLVIRCLLLVLLIHSAHAFLIRLSPSEYGYIDRAAPFGLLYGPVLYFLYRASLGQSINWKTVFYHGIPFVFIFPFYSYILFQSYEFSGLVVYHRVLYSALVISWLVYPVLVAYRAKSRKKENDSESKNFLLSALVILLTLSFFMVLAVTTHILKGLQSDVLSNGLIIFTAMFGAVLYTFIYTIRRLKNSMQHSKDWVAEEEVKKIEPIGSYQKSGLQEEEMKLYANKVDKYMSNKEYLDPKFNLDKLASDLKIPRYYLSQLFSQYYGLNFLTYINGLRIEHACMTLQKDDYEFIIEELVEECGFNSKRSFYRNFHEKAGMTPTEYRESLGL